MLKIEKSPYLGNDVTDRHEIWHCDDEHCASDFEFLKSKMADGRYFK